MTWLGAAFGEWRDRSLLAGDAVGLFWEGSNVMCGGPPAWVRFGRGGKVPVRERGWKFSLVLWTVAGHASLAGVWCNGLKPVENGCGRTLWFCCISGVWDNKRISPHAAYGAPSKSPPTYRGHHVWFSHCFWGSQFHLVFTLGTWKLPTLAPSPVANQVQNAGRRSRGGCSFTADGLQTQRQLI